jgi:hypothetical protein
MSNAINAHEVTDYFLSEAAGGELVKLGQADVRIQRKLKAWAKDRKAEGMGSAHYIAPGKDGSLASPESYALLQGFMGEAYLTAAERALLAQPRKALSDTMKEERDKAARTISTAMRDWRQRFERLELAELEQAKADYLASMGEAERAEAEAEQAEAELEKAALIIREAIMKARKKAANTEGLYSVETAKQLAFHLDAALVAAGGNPEDV